MSNNALKRAVELLNKVKLHISKSEIRTISAIEQAIKMIEERQAMSSTSTDNKELVFFSLILLLDDVVKNLPSILALIRQFYSS